MLCFAPLADDILVCSVYLCKGSSHECFGKFDLATCAVSSRSSKVMGYSLIHIFLYVQLEMEQDCSQYTLSSERTLHCS